MHNPGHLNLMQQKVVELIDFNPAEENSLKY